jgi:hypothetical protein
MYSYFPEDITHAVSFREMVFMKLLKFNLNCYELFSTKITILFWGPFEWSLFLDPKYSYSPEKNLY